MDLNATLPLLAGPGGAVVVLALTLVAIVKWKLMVPGYVYENAEKRIAALERENSELNNAVISLGRENSEMKADIRALNREMEALKGEYKLLRSRFESER